MSEKKFEALLLTKAELARILQEIRHGKEGKSEPRNG